MPIRLLAVGVSLVVAGFAAGWLLAEARAVLPAHGEALAISASRLMAQPKKFAGQRVLLRGRLSECLGWECALCPEADDLGPCLQLTFRPLLPGTGFGSQEQEAIFRFASVVLTATFDATCITDGACLDRQVVLHDTEVVEVTRRRANAEGFWRDTEQTPLIPYDGAMTAQILFALKQAGGSAEARVFTTGLPNPVYVTCTSGPFDDSDPGKWPATLAAALRASSNADWFHCQEVRRVDGSFVVQIPE
ncbi:hypothetical protein [Sandarakinorhabdus sp.]|uniref:hypothetical protein n=1 Tax=Sandarakinorhabdus sp. TaxID=1916663 RepID=UPI00333E89D1